MNQKLTEKEIKKIQKMRFSNPVKMCAVAQLILDTCQVVSVNTFSTLNGKHRNTILQQKSKLNGVEIEGRKFISFVQ